MISYNKKTGTVNIGYYNQSLGSSYGRSFKRAADGRLMSVLWGNAWDKGGDWVPCPIKRVKETLDWVCPKQDRVWDVPARQAARLLLRKIGVHTR